jgi:hypothetical protein
VDIVLACQGFHKAQAVLKLRVHGQARSRSFCNCVSGFILLIMSGYGQSGGSVHDTRSTLRLALDAPYIVYDCHYQSVRLCAVWIYSIRQ